MAKYITFCNGITQEISAGHSQSQIPGDKYEIEIDSLDCENFLIKYHSPVILEEEKFFKTRAIITQTVDLEIMSLIKFEYTINEILYKRIQYMKPNWKETYPKIQVGKQIDVLYWQKNPQRSVLSINYKKHANKLYKP